MCITKRGVTFNINVSLTCIMFNGQFTHLSNLFLTTVGQGSKAGIIVIILPCDDGDCKWDSRMSTIMGCVRGRSWHQVGSSISMAFVFPIVILLPSVLLVEGIGLGHFCFL